MKKTFTFLAILTSAAVSLPATMLTFDFDPSLNTSDLISQDYGDNVSATTVGSFLYGSEGGFTPNVSVSYFGDQAGLDQLSFWDTDYDELINVAYYEPEVDSVFGITFTAETGFNVNLQSFQVGYFTNSGNLAELSVLNGDLNGSSLFSVSNQTIGGGTASVYTPNVTSDQLTILFTTTGAGATNDNFGIDNVLFSQVPVPEVSNYAAILGLLAIAYLPLRRRRAQS